MVKTAQHIVNLRKTRGFIRNRKANKAVFLLKDYIVQHTKKKSIWISPSINEEIWKNGIKNIPSFLKIQIAVKDNKAYVELASKEFKHPDFEEKQNKKVPEGKTAEKDVKDQTSQEKKKDTTPKKEEKVEAKEEKLKTAPKKETKKEEVYDLSEGVVKILKDGSVADAKETIKKLNKKDLKKILKFEQAHQNRKGVLQFLESNMR